MANKITNLINDTQLKRKISSIEKKINIKDSIKRIPLFNNFGLVVNKEDIKSSASNEMFYCGLSLAAPFLEHFCDFRDGCNQKELNNDAEDLSIKNLLVNNVSELKSLTGINALNIRYDFQKDSLLWSRDFEEFLKSKEIKITHWINPVEQLITSIIISKKFNCYFDLDHHFKVLLSILKMDDIYLEKHFIVRSTYIDKQLNFLNKQSLQFGNKLNSSIFLDKYYPKYKSYPVLKFAKSLPSGCSKYLNKYLERLSLKNKKQNIIRFKASSYIVKILTIAFDYNFISDRDANSFRYIYNSQSDKKLLLDNCIKMPYSKFKLAMEGYNRL